MASVIFEQPAALSGAECDAAIALTSRFGAQAGGVLGATGYAPDPRIRDVATTHVARQEDTAWLYGRLDMLLGQAGAAFDLPVAAITEPVQIVRYDVGNHFNHWHSDAGGDLGTARMVSASIELSDAADYDGGLLQIVPDLLIAERRLARGGMTAFPSRAIHRVTPVTRGTRFALVMWAGS